MYDAYIKFPTADTPVPDEIKNNTRFFPFLKDALGAIDGSHLPVHPPAKERARYRDRKGQTSQNMLATCTLDLRFCYVLAGWEGSASDSAIFADARKHDFHVPSGKYFLADAGFASCRELLVPYRGVRYHLREWAAAGKRYAVYLDVYSMYLHYAAQIIQKNYSIYATNNVAMP